MRWVPCLSIVVSAFLTYPALAEEGAHGSARSAGVAVSLQRSGSAQSQDIPTTITEDDNADFQGMDEANYQSKMRALLGLVTPTSKQLVSLDPADGSIAPTALGGSSPRLGVNFTSFAGVSYSYPPDPTIAVSGTAIVAVTNS